MIKNLSAFAGLILFSSVTYQASAAQIPDQELVGVATSAETIFGVTSDSKKEKDNNESKDTGEASYNVEDCSELEDDDSEVEAKELDDCESIVK